MATASAHIEAVQQTHNSIIDLLTQKTAARDSTALARLHVDDYVLIDSFGETLSKNDYLHLVQSGQLTYNNIDTKDLKVRLYGDAAIVTGHTSGKAMVNGQMGSGEFAFTSVYVRQGGEWRLASGHVSMVDPRFVIGQ